MKLCGLVLAGGRSSRMGRDKGSLVHPDGRTLARRACDLLREAGCEVVVLSLRHDQEVPDGLEELAGVEIVRDPPGEGAGPVGGIVAGMRLHPESDWLVVACDLPRLDLPTLSALPCGAKDDDLFLAYRSESDGLPEPLCALYRRDSLATMEQALAADFRCPRKILLQAGARLLDPVTPGALANANTPEEWSAATDRVPEWRAELLEIWISPGNDFRGRHEKGRLRHEIRKVAQVECVAGMGLRGDRYFAYKEDFKGQATFFDAATLAEVRARFGKPGLSASAFRRNLVVAGEDLGAWVGRRFKFQGIVFEGTEECKPCYWMDEAVAPGAEKFLKSGFRGGLRAKILTSGVLTAQKSAGA